MYCFLTIFALISLKEADNLRLGDGSSGILANTKYGTISGKVFSTPSAKEFYAFLDIPYASPPIGKLRFQKPLPPEPWKEVLNATENTKICWQLRLRSEKVENDPRENEDCLYLNVYVPKDPSENEPLAVMVYIHGGMFSFNDGTFKSYKPYNFVERDIIMVSFNFRQGPLGFLTTNDSVIPGNVGLWDQNIALKWVQQNIEAFGGDPKKVTLMGHSSGAVSVTFHMLSKQSAVSSWTKENTLTVDKNPELVYDRMTGIKEENKAAFWQELKAVYTKEPFHKNFTGLIKMKGDLRFSNPVIRFADLASRYVDVYFYQFSYFGEMNANRDVLDEEGLGKAAHCAELPYLMYYEMDGDTKTYPKSDIRMRHILSDLFANFIKYQNPTPKRDSRLQNIIWPKLNSNTLLYLDIDDNLTIKENPRYYRQCRTIFDKYYEHPLTQLN
ncbi:unnamed protein product [Acanthoscelides obtectus]|uniref:Carboxylic ester hydrolase n=1 Tax=Acanthoscelides obtectus TaxID=200917 RepID=A0A9P0KSQ2_ACAOB|nr:unnamed protein product [Acanthoscelides obtectus]CAK1676902.1 Esterase B1 [Acanthoscelides obtectus]